MAGQGQRVTLPNNLAMTIPLRDGGQGQAQSSDPSLCYAEVSNGSLQIRCGSPRTGTAQITYTPSSGQGQKQEIQVEVEQAWDANSALNLGVARFEEGGTQNRGGQQRA